MCSDVSVCVSVYESENAGMVRCVLFIFVLLIVRFVCEAVWFADLHCSHCADKAYGCQKNILSVTDLMFAFLLTLFDVCFHKENRINSLLVSHVSLLCLVTLCLH